MSFKNKLELNINSFYLFKDVFYKHVNFSKLKWVQYKTYIWESIHI